MFDRNRNKVFLLPHSFCVAVNKLVSLGKMKFPTYTQSIYRFQYMVLCDNLDNNQLEKQSENQRLLPALEENQDVLLYCNIKKIHFLFNSR